MHGNNELSFADLSLMACFLNLYKFNERIHLQANTEHVCVMTIFIENNWQFLFV